VVIGASAGGVPVDYRSAESFNEVADGQQQQAAIIRGMLLAKDKSDAIEPR